MEQGRLFKIVYHLLDKGRATAPELAEKFEVSVRTIYRDLDAISAAGIPIYTVQGKGGGIFILPEFVLEKSLLTPQEKEQILMALQGLAAAEDSRTDEPPYFCASRKNRPRSNLRPVPGKARPIW